MIQLKQLVLLMSGVDIFEDIVVGFSSIEPLDYELLGIVDIFISPDTVVVTLDQL